MMEGVPLLACMATCALANPIPVKPLMRSALNHLRRLMPSYNTTPASKTSLKFQLGEHGTMGYGVKSTFAFHVNPFQ